MINFLKEHRRGVIGTSIFHLILLIFFILYKGFTTPLPLPDEQGILVNFGTEESGVGNIEPIENILPQPVEETVVPDETYVEESPVEEIVEEEVVTQEIEEAPEIKAAEKKKKDEEVKKKLEDEKKRLELLAEKKKTEEKRIQDSIERVRREEQLTKIKNLTDKLGKGDSESTATSQGNSKGVGNQGTEDGDPNSSNYGGNSKGDGTVSFSLAGRNPLTLPKPAYAKQESGYVVVEVIVNREGEVVDAIPGKKGSTTTDNNLMEAAKKAALNAKFDTKPDAPPRQTGTITYHFVLE